VRSIRSLANLRVTEIKAFVPAKDLGFTQASEGGGVACFRFKNASFMQSSCMDGIPPEPEGGRIRAP
jgi:hypothetical protein